MPDQAEIHRKCASRVIEDRLEATSLLATSLLNTHFSNLSDKAQAWLDLHGLTQDEDRDVREKAAEALGAAFRHVPDKAQAWKDLHRLTQDEDRDV